MKIFQDLMMVTVIQLYKHKIILQGVAHFYYGLFILCMSFYVYVRVHECTLPVGVRTACRSHFCPTTIPLPGTEFQWSDLAASAFLYLLGHLEDSGWLMIYEHVFLLTKIRKTKQLDSGVMPEYGKQDRKTRNSNPAQVICDLVSQNTYQPMKANWMLKLSNCIYIL